MLRNGNKITIPLQQALVSLETNIIQNQDTITYILYKQLSKLLTSSKYIQPSTIETDVPSLCTLESLKSTFIQTVPVTSFLFSEAVTSNIKQCTNPQLCCTNINNGVIDGLLFQCATCSSFMHRSCGCFCSSNNIPTVQCTNCGKHTQMSACVLQACSNTFHSNCALSTYHYQHNKFYMCETGVVCPTTCSDECFEKFKLLFGNVTRHKACDHAVNMNEMIDSEITPYCKPCGNDLLIFIFVHVHIVHIVHIIFFIFFYF
jgi:hypothetical protein